MLLATLAAAALLQDSVIIFFFSSRRRHTRYWRDWSSDVCSSDLRDPRQRPRHALPRHPGPAGAPRGGPGGLARGGGRGGLADQAPPPAARVLRPGRRRACRLGPRGRALRPLARVGGGGRADARPRARVRYDRRRRVRPSAARDAPALALIFLGPAAGDPTCPGRRAPRSRGL